MASKIGISVQGTRSGPNLQAPYLICLFGRYGINLVKAVIINHIQRLYIHQSTKIYL